VFQTASRSVQPFLHSSRQRVPILYNGPPFLPQHCLFTPGIWTRSNTWYSGPTRVHTPNGISIASADFARFTIVTGRTTDRSRYLVCNNRPYLRSTAMRPNNIHRVSKNVPPLACYNIDTHEWILIFFRRNVTDKVGNQKTLYYTTLSNLCFCTAWQNGE